MSRWGQVSRKAVSKKAIAAAATVTLLMAGCDRAGGDETARPPARPPTSATPTTATTAVTVTAPPTTAPAPVPAPVAPVPAPVAPAPGAPPPPPSEVAVAPPEGLLPGMRGPAVLQLQQRLVDLRYDPGALDGRYGGGVTVAVMAFQKVVGLPRSGRATPATLAALTTATEPAPMLPDGGPSRVEIDLKRQVLFLWKDGALLRILPVSTGNGRRYCEDGRCGVAVTPSGSYRIERRIKGKRKSYLGILYNPLYFRGGYAIHGSPSVPAGPVSHGCVRIPIFSSLWFFDNVPNGTPVYLIGGKNPATPFPPDPPPPPPPPVDPQAPPPA
jgi:peptidoglycan hydrolase-like protein with peptidoglycan-binding domain